MLLGGGAALFLYGRTQLQALAANHITRVAGHAAVEQAVHYDRMSRLGLWMAATGLAAAVVFALLRARRPSHSSPES